MSQTTSATTGRRYGLERVCRTWERSRSAFYARRARVQRSASADSPRRRGPTPALSDAQLLAAIHSDLARSPFQGEGHRKVHARLRILDGIRVSRTRVLRVMRAQGLLSPHRGRQGEPQRHDGTIVTSAPDVMWGTDGARVLTVDDGWVWTFAAVDHFKIRIIGRQAHGAQPQTSIDPVVMASQAVTAFQTIRSRNLSPLEPSVITVGVMRGGERFNIIPMEMWLEGTVRTYNPDVRDAVERRMDEILDGITTAGGGSYVLDYDRGTPATINDRDLTAEMAPTLAKIVGDENVLVIDPTMGGEDFAYFANEVPGFYYRLGSVNPELGSGGHHTPDFRADDASIPIGMRAMSNLLLDYLKSRRPSTD